MQKFTIVTQGGQELSTTKADFYAALRSGSYELYEQDNIRVLLHKENQAAIEAYRIHHNNVSNQWGKNDRLSRCLDDMGRVCRKDCKVCDKKRQSRIPISLDARKEAGLQHPNENSDLLSDLVSKEMAEELHRVLKTLETAERDIVYALYLDGETISLADYAKVKNVKYSTARSLRDKAFRRIAKLAEHLKEYL